MLKVPTSGVALCVRFAKLLLAATWALQGDIFDQWSDLDVRGDYQYSNFIVVDTRRNVVPNVLIGTLRSDDGDGNGNAAKQQV